MPLPQKRRRSRSRSRTKEKEGGRHDLRRAEDSSSSDSSTSSSASSPRYQSLLALRLSWSRLQLPPSADGDDDPDSADPRDHTPPDVLQALARRSFLDEEMLDALVEYQVRKCLSDETHQDYSGEFRSATETHRRRDSREFHPADVPMVSVDSADEITHEDFLKDCAKLRSRATPVDEHTKLDERQHNELYLRHARFRIKALLLLKGKAIDKLDDAALDRKYPPNLVAEHSYFLDYERHNAFGWYFDSDLCRLASLTDYQRLVLFNDCGVYEDWSSYRLYYTTPEADRDYLLYWEAITEKIKWIEDYIHRGRTSDVWDNMWTKAMYQAVRIATEFDNINRDLATVGFMDFIWSTRINVLFRNDRDGVLFELWRRVIKDQMCFREALKEVHDLRMFPTQLLMGMELDGQFTIEKEFLRCTVGITEKVPEYKARELIAQQIKNKLVLTHGYEQYAAKKLKVAEYIGLIRKTST